MTSALAGTIEVSTIRRPGMTVARTPVSVPSAIGCYFGRNHGKDRLEVVTCVGQCVPQRY